MAELEGSDLSVPATIPSYLIMRQSLLAVVRKSSGIKPPKLTGGTVTIGAEIVT